jgi:hypothetical protein
LSKLNLLNPLEFKIKNPDVNTPRLEFIKFGLRPKVVELSTDLYCGLSTISSAHQRKA